MAAVATVHFLELVALPPYLAAVEALVARKTTIQCLEPTALQLAAVEAL
jgi:hypothetical protein